VSAVAVESQAAIFRKERLAARTSLNPCMSFVQTADGTVLGNALLEKSHFVVSGPEIYVAFLCPPKHGGTKHTGPDRR